MSPESARVVALACNEVGRLFDHWHSVPQGVDALCEMAVIPPIVARILKQCIRDNINHRHLGGWTPMSRELTTVYCLSALERFGWKISYDDIGRINERTVLEMGFLDSRRSYMRSLACFMTSWNERALKRGSIPRDILPLEVTLMQALLRWNKVRGKTYVSDKMLLSPQGLILVSFGSEERTLLLKHAYGWDDCDSGVLVQTMQNGFVAVGL